MSTQDWAAFILTLATILTIAVGGVRFLVKHYFEEMKYELKPNSGSSLKDQVSRLERSLAEQKADSTESRNRQESKIDKMYEILIKHIAASDK